MNWIFCGVFPNISSTLIPKQLLKQGVLKLRARFIPSTLEKLKMELIEEDHNTGQDNDKFIANKSRRGKERKLGEIIEKVFLWRKLFTGADIDENKTVKLTLDDAANKVGISKKSLDDYLNQLKYVILLIY